MNRGERYVKSGKNGGCCEEIQKNPESYPQVINILWISGEWESGNVGQKQDSLDHLEKNKVDVYAGLRL